MVNHLWGSQQIALRRGLRQARKRSRLTQAQLSKKLAKPQSYISKYENGERRLDYLEVKEICFCCQITIAEFDELLTQTTAEINKISATLTEAFSDSSVAMRISGSMLVDEVLRKKWGKQKIPTAPLNLPQRAQASYR